MSFPWKSSHPVLPTNKSTCERRVRSLTRKLNNTTGMLKVYHSIIEEQLRRGFIEQVPISELAKPCHYIPHHGVHKDSATTPLRIVYDCSSREAKHLASLNDCLETGPPFLQELPAILIRFRCHKFGIALTLKRHSYMFSCTPRTVTTLVFSGPAVLMIPIAHFIHTDSKLSCLDRPARHLCCMLPFIVISHIVVRQHPRIFFRICMWTIFCQGVLLKKSPLCTTLRPERHYLTPTLS